MVLANSDYETGFVGAAMVVNALRRRSREDTTFNIDISLLHYDMWLYKYGLHDVEVQAYLRKLHPDIDSDHATHVFTTYYQTKRSIDKLRPGILDEPRMYNVIPGKLWGEQRDISVIAPPFNLTKTQLCVKPSGRRGWCKNVEWVAQH